MVNTCTVETCHALSVYGAAYCVSHALDVLAGVSPHRAVRYYVSTDDVSVLVDTYDDARRLVDALPMGTSFRIGQR